MMIHETRYHPDMPERGGGDTTGPALGGTGEETGVVNVEWDLEHESWTNAAYNDAAAQAAMPGVLESIVIPMDVMEKYWDQSVEDIEQADAVITSWLHNTYGVYPAGWRWTQ